VQQGVLRYTVYGLAGRCVVQPSQSASETVTKSTATDKAYGNRNLEPATTPELFGPDFPIPPAVAKFFRKLFRRTGA
jgi:hypothetical protein